MGQKERCLEYMRKAIEADPKHADALNWVGYTYAEEGIRLDEAEELIKRALEVKPNSGYIIDSLGWVYYKKGKLKEALFYLQKAHRLLPDDPTITEHLGDVFLKMGDEGKALELYRRAMDLKPTDEQKKKIQMKIERLLKKRQDAKGDPDHL